MKTVSELKADKTHEVKSAGDITQKCEDEDRSMTEEERQAFDKHMEVAERIQQQIDAAEATNARKAKYLEAEAGLKNMDTPERRTTPITVKDPLDGIDDPADPQERRFRYNGELTAFRNDRRGHEDAYRSGLWIRAMFCRDDRARRECINRGIGEFRAMSETVNTAGGVLVPEEFEQAVIDLRKAYGVFRQYANVMPMGRDVLSIPRNVTDVTASYTDENTAITETTQAFNNVQLTAKKLGILTRMSSELAEDAVIDIADYLARVMAWAFALKEDTDGFAGTGAAANGGTQGIQWIFENDNTLAGAIDLNTNADTFAEVTAAGIAAVIAQLPDYAEANARFYCSRVGAELMFGRLMAAGGGNTMTDLAGRPQRSYLGYPIVTVNAMNSSTGTLDNKVLFLFGDLRLSSTLGDRRGITVRTSDERYFDADQIAIKATERIAIVNHDYGTTTAADTGPIVAGIGVA